MRKFKVTGWSFMTRLKKIKFFQNPEHMFVVEYKNLIKVFIRKVLYVLKILFF